MGAGKGRCCADETKARCAALQPGRMIRESDLGTGSLRVGAIAAKREVVAATAGFFEWLTKSLAQL